MQNGKASLDVQAELVKLAINSEFFVDEETKFFVALWERKKVLLHFSLGEISAIFKQKGSRRDACKYRGITLSSILINILVNVILVRVSAKYEVFWTRDKWALGLGKER